MNILNIISTVLLLSYRFANGIGYYGLSLNTSNLGGDPFVNFFIAGAVEIPAYLLIVVLFRRIGRVWSISSTMIIAGCTLLLVAAVPKGALLLPTKPAAD